MSTYEDYTRKMESLKNHIRMENTGTPDELAKKIEVSRRTLFHYLSILRDNGDVIKFSRIRQTYYYCE